MKMSAAEVNTQIHALKVALKIARTAGNLDTVNLLERLLPRFEILASQKAVRA